VQLEESTRKLHELVAINRRLDADCCQLMSAKHALEMKLETFEDASADENCNVDTKVCQRQRCCVAYIKFHVKHPKWN